MSRQLSILLLLLGLSLPVLGQERVYVRTNCARYAPGDRIWFRCYLFEGAEREPSGESLYIYTELADTLGSVLTRVKVIQRDGVFSGYMDIPEETPGGVLLLRAYTLGMAASPESVFVKALPVGRSVFRHGTGVTEGGEEPARCRVPASFMRASLADRDSVLLFFGQPDLKEDEILDLSLSVSADREPLSSIVSYFRTSPAPSGGKGFHEKTQEITGTVVRSLSGRPVSSAKVSLMSPQAGIVAVREAGEDGKFRFEGLDYPAGTQYVLKSTDMDGKGKYALKIDETVFPSFVYDPGQIAWMDAVGEDPQQWDESLMAGSDHLLQSSIVTARQEESRDVFSANSDLSYGPEQIKEMNVTCIHELLRRVPGVFVIEEQCYIRAQTSIMNEWQPAAIAVDGVIWEGLDLDEIEMPNVERVDIFKTGQTVLWGSAGGNGVISITTKSGAYADKDVARPDPNIRKVTPLGYQRQEKYHPGGLGNRSLLWIPQVTSGEVGFSIPSSIPSVRIVLEGVSSLGRLVHEEWVL